MVFWSRALLAYLITTCFLFGNNKQQTPAILAAEKQTQSQCPCEAYSVPYDFGICNPWNFYTAFNFIYWQPAQENMEVGLTFPLTPTDGRTVYDFAKMDFDYKPGFQVGFGAIFGKDEWDTFLEYTWLRGHDHKHISVNPLTTGILPTWGLPNASQFSIAKAEWALSMDILDWTLGKSYLLTPKIMLKPSIGLRAIWIRQYVTVAYEVPSLLQFNQQKSHSWGIGPSLAISSNWLLGKGFKLIGSGEVDIPYTQYTALSANEGNAGSLLGDFVYHEKNLGLLRPHTEITLGLGWGRLFGNRSLHCDFSAEYSFQMFLHQNMFRKRVDDTAKGFSVSPNGELFIQGLTLSARIDL